MQYKRQVSYTFETAGSKYAIVSWSDGELLVEETRKNGQEDSHFSIGLIQIKGKWQIAEDEQYLERWEIDEAREVIRYIDSNQFTPELD